MEDIGAEKFRTTATFGHRFTSETSPRGASRLHDRWISLNLRGDAPSARAACKVRGAEPEHPNYWGGAADLIWFKRS